MGVNLTPLISDLKKPILINSLMGKKIALDAFNIIFQFLATIRGIDGTPLKDLQGRVTSHLSGLFYRTLNLIEKGIRPIYVFDGAPNVFKKAEIERRRAIREEAYRKMREAQDLGRTKEAAKYAQATSKLTGEMIEESKELLGAMGIPVIQAAEDGESQAAYLVKEGLAWAVGSQDYDAFLFKAERIVRNLSHNRTRKIRNTVVKTEIEYYSLPKFLEHLKINHEQLVDMALLIGVDFFPGVPGIGPKTAYKLIKKHGSIDNIINNGVEVKGEPINLDLDEINLVRNIFLKPKINIDIPKIKWSKPNMEKIKEILCEKHDFNNHRVEIALTRLNEKKTSAIQHTLDGFLRN